MSALAPYTNAMRLGQGFNSYTQEICIENAVVIEPARKVHKRNSRRSLQEPHALHPPVISRSSANESASRPGSSGTGNESVSSDLTAHSAPAVGLATSVHPAEITPPHKNMVQIVTYSSRMVENVSDIMDALNISSSASIKYGTIKGSGSASIVNENKVMQSDLNYIVTVKVTNETSPVADKMTFNPIPELDNSKFTEVFGDCFISGFTEGGEFSAIVSIKVNDKSKLSAVKAAAEAEIMIPAAPGLSVGAGGGLDKQKSDVWDDTETCISVNWAGGGDLKPVNDKWDLATVVEVATRFPHLVETCAQRTSAILTRYTSLRSFNELDARNPPEEKFRILDYDLCTLYTLDLFSDFLAYKSIWADLTDMLKHSEQYRERDPTKSVPNPIPLTIKGLEEARLLSRKGLTQITDATKALITSPGMADLDESGQQRPVPYTWPGDLKARLPVKHHGLTIREQAEFTRRETNNGLLTTDEVAKIGLWARDDSLDFSPLAGDPTPGSRAWFGKSKDTLFCTLDSAQSSGSVDDMTKLRFHAHESHSINWLSIFGGKSRSKRCHGHVSAIGFSTTKDTNTRPSEDGTHRVSGRANRNHAFWSQPLADLKRSKIARLRVEYSPGSGCLAGLVAFGSKGEEVTSWKEYGQAKIDVPTGTKVIEQEPPNQRGGWVLAGFWGHADSMVITSVGAIWKKA